MEVFPKIRSLLSKIDRLGFNGDEYNYFIKSLWVMACAEFENILRTHIENTADKYELKNISQFHTNFLLRGFYEDQTAFNFKDILNIHKNNSLIFKKERFVNGFQGFI